MQTKCSALTALLFFNYDCTVGMVSYRIISGREGGGNLVIGRCHTCGDLRTSTHSVHFDSILYNLKERKSLYFTEDIIENETRRIL